MPIGLQVLNDNGDIVIDEEYRNFALHAKGTATMGSTDIGGTALIYACTITVTGCTTPMLALKSANYVSVIGASVSGSTFTYEIYSNTPSFTFDWYVFDVAAVPADTFGFAVYNAAGALVFHSSSKAMRVVRSDDAGTGGTSGIALAAGRTYAVIQGANGWRVRNFFRAQQGTWKYISYSAGHKFTGDTLFIPYPAINLVMPTGAPLAIDESQPSGDEFDYETTPQAPRFTVVDVTNF
jgi:hypothetical protein